MKRRIVLAAMVIFVTADAEAQRKTTFSGAGTTSCGQYLQDRKTDSRFDYQYTQWVSGYFSAYNFFSTYPQIERQSAETVLAYLDKHCRDNPLHLVIQGVDAMVGELGGWSLQKQKQ